MTYRYQRCYTGTVALVVADLAGTTVDYGSCAPAGAFMELFRNHGIDATVEQARGPMGMHKRDHIRIMSRMPAIAAQWREKHDRACTEGDIKQMFEEFIPMQLACLPQFYDLIPGTAEVMRQLQRQSIRIGATTGYNVEMINLVLDAAAKQGYKPDASCSAAQVADGRPAPWMIYRCMEATGVYPPAAVIKIGDTVSDIEAGLSAGVWSVGVAKTGNMLGLPLVEVEAMPSDDLTSRLKTARARLAAAGAHYVIDSIEELPATIELVNTRLAQGETP